MLFYEESAILKVLKKYIFKPIKNHSNWHNANEIMGFYGGGDIIEANPYEKEDLYFFILIAIEFDNKKYIPKKFQKGLALAAKKGKKLKPALKKKLGKESCKEIEKYTKINIDNIKKVYKDKENG